MLRSAPLDRWQNWLTDVVYFVLHACFVQPSTCGTQPDRRSRPSILPRTKPRSSRPTTARGGRSASTCATLRHCRRRQTLSYASSLGGKSTRTSLRTSPSTSGTVRLSICLRSSPLAPRRVSATIFGLTRSALSFSVRGLPPPLQGRVLLAAFVCRRAGRDPGRPLLPEGPERDGRPARVRRPLARVPQRG